MMFLTREMKHLRTHFLSYTVIPLVIFVVAGSYYRFMIAHDYLVYYEGECDPYTEQCFLYCEDEECSEPSYYTEIVRRANKIMSLCGDNVSGCEQANVCTLSEADCQKTYCDPNVAENICEELEADDLQVDIPADEGIETSGGEVINPEL